jgi:hypothetical protein
MSGAGADGVGLVVRGLQGSRRILLAQGDALDSVIELGSHLLPGGDRRRGLGVLELGAEHLQEGIGGELPGVPGLLDRRQASDQLEQLLLLSLLGQEVHELPGGVAVLRLLEDHQVTATGERGSRLLLGHRGHGPLALEVGAALVAQDAHVPGTRDERADIALDERGLHRVRRQLGR